MDYLDRLKELDSGKQATCLLPKVPKPPFDSKDSSYVARFQKTPPRPLPSKVGAGDTPHCAEQVTSCCWLLTYRDGSKVEVHCTPAATHAEVLAGRADAVTAEPFVPTMPQPSAPLANAEQRSILAWLALIEETDPATIADVVRQCQADPEARRYYLGRAAADLPKPDPFPDDRRTCRQCSNLRAGICSIAAPGALVSANRGYRPDPARLVRCEGYAPGAADPDQRPGGERWPGLTHD